MCFYIKIAIFPKKKTQNLNFLTICYIALRVGVGLLKSQFLTKSCNCTEREGVLDPSVNNLTQVSRTLKKILYPPPKITQHCPPKYK